MGRREAREEEDEEEKEETVCVCLVVPTNRTDELSAPGAERDE